MGDSSEQGWTPARGATRHDAKAPARHGNGFLAPAASFLPWIVYWILVGNVSFRTAVTIAFVLSVGGTLLARLRGQRPKVLDIGGNVAFLVLLVVTYTTNDHFLERWLQPLTNGALLAITLGSVLIGKPFTLQYARESVPAEIAALPGFVYINRLITWVWVAAFAVMTASATVPPVAQGAATLRDGGSTLSIACYWIIPFTALGLAGLFSGWFPDWFTARLGGPATGDVSPGASATTENQPPENDRIDGVELRVTPRDALVDTPISVSVLGLSPNTEVTLVATQTDVMGQEFRSQARFAADRDGVVDASRAPLSGTWDGADADGLIWSMRVPDDEVADIFLPALGAAPITVSAVVKGVGTLTKTAVRRTMAEGVTRFEVSDGGVVGTLFLPAGNGPHAGVALFGGSEGGVDAQAATAALLASHGYAALVVGYFGCAGLPDALVEIPLERFRDGIHWLRDHRLVDGRRVGAVAISKGAEGLLAAAAHLPDLDLRAAVVTSPAHVVWQAVGDQGPAVGRSSWTLAGRPLPFVTMNGEALMPEMLRNAILGQLRRRQHTQPLLHLGPAYSLEDTSAVDVAAIPVERIAAPLLFISGDADALWPSTTMTAAALRRRAAAGAGEGDEHRHYPDAGHLIRMPHLPTQAQWTGGIAFGGTPRGLAAAQADAGPRTLAFLAAHLQRCGEESTAAIAPPVSTGAT